MPSGTMAADSFGDWYFRQIEIHPQLSFITVQRYALKSRRNQCPKLKALASVYKLHVREKSSTHGQGRGKVTVQAREFDVRPAPEKSVSKHIYFSLWSPNPPSFLWSLKSSYFFILNNRNCVNIVFKMRQCSLEVKSIDFRQEYLLLSEQLLDRKHFTL